MKDFYETPRQIVQRKAREKELDKMVAAKTETKYTAGEIIDAVLATVGDGSEAEQVFAELGITREPKVITFDVMVKIPISVWEDSVHLVPGFQASLKAYLDDFLNDTFCDYDYLEGGELLLKNFAIDGEIQQMAPQKVRAVKKARRY